MKSGRFVGLTDVIALEFIPLLFLILKKVVTFGVLKSGLIVAPYFTHAQIKYS
jgi:hypothetical protein